MLNPSVILYVGGGIVFLLVLWAKGYLGLGDLFGAAAVVRPGPLLGARTPSKDIFAKAVKAAIEEAHDQIAESMANTFRDQVVAAHTASFTSAGPALTPGPAPAPASHPAAAATAPAPTPATPAPAHPATPPVVTATPAPTP